MVAVAVAFARPRGTSFGAAAAARAAHLVHPWLAVLPRPGRFTVSPASPRAATRLAQLPASALRSGAELTGRLRCKPTTNRAGPEGPRRAQSLDSPHFRIQETSPGEQKCRALGGPPRCGHPGLQADTPQSQALHPSLLITADRVGSQLIIPTFPVLKVLGTGKGDTGSKLCSDYSEPHPSL